MNYAPAFSVEKWGDLLGLPKLDHPKCFKRLPRSKIERRELEEYNIRDAMISAKAVDFLQQNFNRLGANLKLTIASTAMDLYRRKYQKESLHMPDKDTIKEHYKGYYGGRTEAVKRGFVKNLKNFDINSQYASVMNREYPHPNYMRHSNKITKKTVLEYEGLYYCKVIAPKLYMPYIPMRTKQKLLFPQGEFWAYLTAFEIREALKLGYDFQFKHGWLYLKTFYPFKEYMQVLYDQRLDLQKSKNPGEVVIKLCMNSLYGKWAQNFMRNEEIKHINNCSFKELQDCPIGYLKGEWVVMGEREGKCPDFVNPIFSAYTTAYARDMLYKLIAKDEKNFYYCDTDSLISKHDYPVSSRLGGLKLVGSIKQGIIVRPKMYMFDHRCKCKGVPKISSEKFEDILSHKRVAVEHFTQFKESVRRGFSFNQRHDFYKSLSLEDSKRSWPEPFSTVSLQDSAPITV
jgi:hypothetical protein